MEGAIILRALGAIAVKPTIPKKSVCYLWKRPGADHQARFREWLLLGYEPPFRAMLSIPQFYLL